VRALEARIRMGAAAHVVATTSPLSCFPVVAEDRRHNVRLSLQGDSRSEVCFSNRVSVGLDWLTIGFDEYPVEEGGIYERVCR
jgi:hypothetical protein